MEHVIGIDFGNANSYVAYISGIDEDTRRGGNVKGLLPINMQMGIPSTFHINARGKKSYGITAAQASPSKNRRNMLKNRIGTQEEIDGHTVNYDDEIIAFLKYLVDTANLQLEQQIHEKSHLISLAYPVTYTDGQANHLIELAQRVILDNGEHLQVWGRIKEPEAAALSYLGDLENVKDTDQTVMVYDLGAGTFDASVVTIRWTEEGNVRYFEVLDNIGVPFGGEKFTEALVSLIREQAEVDLENTDADKNALLQAAETIKIALSTENEYDYDYSHDENGDSSILTITREQLEEITEGLVQETVEATLELYERVPIKPTKIVMVGGQSQMPVIRRRLAQAFPMLGESIIFHKCHQAIAEGAARFGAIPRPSAQITPGPVPPTPPVPPVVLRTGRMIGLAHVTIDPQDPNSGKRMETLIPRNTPIPLEHPVEMLFHNTRPSLIHKVFFYQAKKDEPDVNEIDGEYPDFQKIVSLTIDFHTDEPAVFNFWVSVNIDEKGIMEFAVRSREGEFAPVSIKEQVNVV